VPYKDKQKQIEYRAAYYLRKKTEILEYRARPEIRAKKREYSKRWRAKYPDKLKFYGKRWYENNRRVTIDRAAEWAIANKKRRRSIGAKWIARHPETQKARAATYRDLNREKIKAKNAKWYIANRGIASARSGKRRALKRSAVVGDGAIILAWEKAWRKKKHVVCYWCNGKFLSHNCHSDHIVPLIGGGRHSIENLAVSCAKCNLRKNRKTLEEWNLTLNQPRLL